MNTAAILAIWPRATPMKTSAGALRRLRQFVGLAGVETVAVRFGDGWAPLAFVSPEGEMLAASIARGGVFVTNDAAAWSRIEK